MKTSRRGEAVACQAPPLAQPSWRFVYQMVSTFELRVNFKIKEKYLLPNPEHTHTRTNSNTEI